MAPKIETLTIPPLKVGEGPHWDGSTQSLYLVDIGDSIVVRYDPKTNTSFSVKLNLPGLSFIIPVAGSKREFLIASGLGLYLIKWDGSSDKVDSIELLHKLTNDLETNRINDGKCDPNGRLWFGTMSIKDYFTQKGGKLYSYSRDDGCREYASGIGISNGLAWNGDKMYYVDSILKTVDCFDYNSHGHIENRRVVFDFQKNNMNCYPDGLTIDKDGNLWVACFDGSQVIHVDPRTGELLGKVSLSTSQITSAAWGGPNLEDLYVTSANVHPEGTTISDAGCTFRVSGLPSSGLPMIDFKS